MSQAPTILNTRFQIGQEMTTHELCQVYRRIFGVQPPRARRPEDLAKGLAAALPLRFEFEVNRVRGFAWDNGELPAAR